METSIQTAFVLSILFPMFHISGVDERKETGKLQNSYCTAENAFLQGESFLTSISVLCID